MNKEKALLPALVLVGVTALSAQILFVRELFVIFYGNEAAIGLVLATWLVWGALGSVLFSRLADRFVHPVVFFSWLFLGATLLLPLTVALIRSAPLVLGPIGTQVHGPLTMILTSAVLLFPFCLVNGFFFSLGCSALRSVARQREDAMIGRIYMLEAAGAAVGGILVGILLIRYLDTFPILLVLTAMNALACCRLRHLHARPAAITGASLTVAALCLVLALTGGVSRLENGTRALQWRGYDLVDSRNSPYGSICVTSFGEQLNFYENGLLAFSVPDRMSSEEGALIPALQHPSPASALIIGGDGGGILSVLLEFPGIRKVDYVELDPELVTVSLRHVPETNRSALLDPRVRILHVDGRRHVREMSQAYDLILLNLPDPYTAQINRFYTVEFFLEARRAL